MPPPDTWNFKFNQLRQLDEMEKAELAERDAGTIASLHQGGIISTTIALQELKQSSIITRRFTNISEQDIEDSKSEPAPWSGKPSSRSSSRRWPAASLASLEAVEAHLGGVAGNPSCPAPGRRRRHRPAIRSAAAAKTPGRRTSRPIGGVKMR